MRKPTRPVLSTKIEFVGAEPVTVNGTVDAVMSSIENLFAPPLAESFAVNCQSWFGKPVDVLVSSNLMRVLFSFRRIVSKPNDSLFTQSRPTQRLPWMMASSAVTTSRALTGALWSDCAGSAAAVRQADFRPSAPKDRTGSVASDETSEPFMIVKAPDCDGISLRPAASRMRSSGGVVAGLARGGELRAHARRRRAVRRRSSYVYEPSGSVAPMSRSRSEMLRADANWWEYWKLFGPLIVSVTLSLSEPIWNDRPAAFAVMRPTGSCCPLAANAVMGTMSKSMREGE